MNIYKMNTKMLNIQPRSYGFQPDTTYLIFILIKDEVYTMLQLFFFRVFKKKLNFSHYDKCEIGLSIVRQQYEICLS